MCVCVWFRDFGLIWMCVRVCFAFCAKFRDFGLIWTCVRVCIVQFGSEISAFWEVCVSLCIFAEISCDASEKARNFVQLEISAYNPDVCKCVFRFCAKFQVSVCKCMLFF